MLYSLYNYLSTPEESGKHIGLFRILCAILGGWICSYLGMTLLAYLLPANISQAAVISLLFNTLAWIIVALWICLSQSKLIALGRCLIPTIIFVIALYLLY